MRGPIQTDGPTRGMIVDFDDIDRIVRKVAVDLLDHQNLNEYVDNPTAERIVAWLWERLAPALNGLDELVLWETPNACAVLRSSDFHLAPPLER